MCSVGDQRGVKSRDCGPDCNLCVEFAPFSCLRGVTQRRIVMCFGGGGGGGGSVADSKAELEYEESLQKIRNILDALSDAR